MSRLSLEVEKKLKRLAQDPAVESMIRSILGTIAKIERNEKKMLHEINPQLDNEAKNAIDSKNKAKLQTVIKKLDDMI